MTPGEGRQPECALLDLVVLSQRWMPLTTVSFQATGRGREMSAGLKALGIPRRASQSSVLLPRYLMSKRNSRGRPPAGPELVLTLTINKPTTPNYSLPPWDELETLTNS